MYRLGLKKAEAPEITLSTFIGSWRKQGSSSKNIYFCCIDYVNAFGWVDNENWKILKEMAVPDKFTFS